MSVVNVPCVQNIPVVSFGSTACFLNRCVKCYGKAFRWFMAANILYSSHNYKLVKESCRSARRRVLTAILLKSEFFRNFMPCRRINTHPTFKKIIFSSLFLDYVAVSVQTTFRFETSVPIRHKLQQFFCNVRDNTVLCFVSVTIITVSLRLCVF
jgi:hypothetical protein